MDWLNDLVYPLLRAVVLIVVLLTAFAYLTWYERKLLARFQVRYGPNRAGPFGLLVPVADAVKAIFKEEVIPNHVDKFIYVCLLYTSPSPRDRTRSRMPSSA